MNTIADIIFNSSNNKDEILRRAYEEAIGFDSNWEERVTVYTFMDFSQLVHTDKDMLDITRRV